MVRWALLAVGIFSGSAFAQVADSIALWDEAGRVIQQAKTVGPSWGASPRLNGATIGRTFMMPAPLGSGVAGVAANATANLGPKGVFFMAGRALMNPYVAVASVVLPPLAAAAWEYYRCRGGDRFECDPGALPQTIQALEWPGYSATWHPTPEAACTSFNAAYGGAYTWTLQDTTGYVLKCYASGAGSITAGAAEFRTSAGCAVPEGMPPLQPGPDGRCPTGVFQEKPLEQAVELPVTYPPGLTDQEYADLVNEALGKLKPFNFLDLPEGELRTNVIDSSPLQGPTSTITYGDGTTESQVSYWNIRRVNDDIRDRETSNWDKTTTKTKTTPTGETTTETTTDTKGEDTTADEPTDPCKGLEGTAGCTQLGDVPTDAPAVETRVIDFEVDALGLPASCPAPMSVAVPWGAPIAVPWDVLCEKAWMIRLALLACAAFGSAMMLTLGGKST